MPMPNQSARRRMVPAFPGSRTESSPRHRPEGNAGAGALSCISSWGMRSTARAGEGDERWLIRPIASSPTSERR